MNSGGQVQGINDTAAVWDLYREIHETVREALFGVTTLAGKADAVGAEAVRRLLAAWRRGAFALDTHQPQRDRPNEPTLQSRTTAPPTPLEAARRRTDAAIAQLHRFAEALAQPARRKPARSCARSAPAWASSRRATAIRCAWANKTSKSRARRIASGLFPVTQRRLAGRVHSHRARQR
jgi:hypothetical protein